MGVGTWFGRVWQWGNLIPLLVCPLIIWGVDLMLHLMPGSLLGDKGAIVVLTASLPVVGSLSTVWMYKYLARDLLPPEIPAIVGLLYSQATYMFVLKAAVEGAVGDINLYEWLILTVSVPLSTLII